MESLKETDHLEDLEAHGGMYYDAYEMGWEVLYLFDLALGRGQ